MTPAPDLPSLALERAVDLRYCMICGDMIAAAGDRYVDKVRGWHAHIGCGPALSVWIARIDEDLRRRGFKTAD